MSESSRSPNDTIAILVIDDDESFLRSLVLNLERPGYSVTDVCTAAAGIEACSQTAFDIVLCDLHLPDTDGLSFIRECRARCAHAHIIAMTGFVDSDTVIRTIGAGAFDCISKPFEMEALLLTLEKIRERQRYQAIPSARSVSHDEPSLFTNFIAQSAPMKGIFETVRRLAHFSTTVLIRGESGTGKELLARAIHESSPRRHGRFVPINCGAIPENLMESELFGHRKGAFTDATRDKIGLFEEANCGTIFLDEIGELPLHLQVKLLRVLQEQQIQRVGDERLTSIDVRVIAATLRDLEEDVREGRFRDDLYYRLNVVAIDIPPLRERKEDIPVLVDYFLKKQGKKLGLSIRKVHPDAMNCLINYGWRGNVRELENCIERALVLTETDSIDVLSLPPILQGLSSPPAVVAGAADAHDDNLSIKQRTVALERDLIVRALRKTRGNRTHAAKVLEISHRALLYKLKEYGLEDVEKGTG